MRVRHHGPAPTGRNDWKTIRTLLPYVWGFRGRVALALLFLAIAKIATVSVPLILKEIVDSLSKTEQILPNKF